MKKIVLIIGAILLITCVWGQQPVQNEEVFPVSATVVKQTVKDSTFWLVKEVYEVYRGGSADSLQAVAYIKNLEIRQKEKLKAYLQGLETERQRVQNELQRFESVKGNITETFDSTLIRRVTGVYSMVLGKNTPVNVRLNRNYNIVNAANSTVLGEWKLVSDDIISIFTDDYEVTLKWDGKTNTYNSTGGVNLRLTKQKSK